MIPQGINGIVGGTHHFDADFLEQGQRLAFGFRQDCVGFRPDGGAGVGTDQFGDAEIASQVKMNPFINRIAGDFRKYGREFQPFFFVRTVSGDVFLGHAALAQHFPYIMVGGGEQLPDVGVIVVGGDLFDIGVVVGVDDRQMTDGSIETLPGGIVNQVLFS